MSPVVRHSQGMGNGERYKLPYERCKCFRMPYQRYQWLENAYEY